MTEPPDASRTSRADDLDQRVRDTYDPDEPRSVAASGSAQNPEPEVGSAAWELRRKVLWDQSARDLMAALIKYEDEHPADAICLAPALDVARKTVSDPTPATAADEQQLSAGEAAAVDWVKWLTRVWREVAHDYCEHEGVRKSCANCRGVVSDVADLFAARPAND